MYYLSGSPQIITAPNSKVANREGKYFFVNIDLNSVLFILCTSYGEIGTRILVSCVAYDSFYTFSVSLIVLFCSASREPEATYLGSQLNNLGD